MSTDKKPKISFEFFPPKTDKSLEILKSTTIPQLAEVSPDYFSVTYGAGGSTKQNTFDLVNYIKNNTSIPPAAHLTCVNATKDELNEIAKQYLSAGITRIVALRGDPPAMQGAYQPHPQGYAYAHELVKGLLEIGNFDISVAAFPEVHPEAMSAQADLDYLKQKLDAGANRAITQYCFDTDTILRFVDTARDAGINKTIVPGIMVITDFKQIVSFSQRCQASIPSWLETRFAGTEDNPTAHEQAAISVAVEQCRRLIEAGIEEFHFYTLNKAELTLAICQQLGIKSAAA